MAAEETNNNVHPSRSWYQDVFCLCGKENILGCCCLCPFLLCRRRDPSPRWFQVEDGQLQSKAEEKSKKRKRRRRKKQAGSNEAAKRRLKEDTNTDAAVINRPTLVTSNTSDTGEMTHTNRKHPNAGDHEGTVTDLLKHLLRTAQDISSQSSTAPSCDDTTPPLLRSDDQDRYQPQVVMEIASSPQTEAEIERSLSNRTYPSEMEVSVE